MLVYFEPNVWYKLTNKYYGKEIALDVINDAGESSSGALKMAEWGPRGHSGQYWQIRPHEDMDGTYQLYTWFLGPSKCLSVDGRNFTTVQLSQPGIQRGQRWKIAPWMKVGCWDGTYRLWNTYNGQEMYLDSYLGSKSIYMGREDRAATHWVIEAICPTETD